MRLTQLDGLRGLAAFIVVIHHACLLDPALAAAYDPTATPPRVGLGQRLVDMVLHLFWNGPAAVIIFFVLSGVVLTLPMLGRGYHWPSYYPQRLLRLYAPTVASVLLAFVWTLLIPRQAVGSWWLARHAVSPGSEIVKDLVLVAGTGWLNSALWSLRWEVWFSLLLPLYLIFAAKVTRRWWITVALAAALQLVVELRGDNALKYLPVFLMGCAIALARDEILPVLQRVPQVPAVLVGLVALNAPWWPVPLPATTWLVSLGATLIVAALLVDGPVTRFLNTRLLGWLGRISFSLYLVHEPLVVNLGTLGVTNPFVAIAIVVPVALVVAELFYRLVEQPSLKLAKAVGSGVRARLSRG